MFNVGKAVIYWLRDICALRNAPISDKLAWNSTVVRPLQWPTDKTKQLSSLRRPWSRYEQLRRCFVFPEAKKPNRRQNLSCPSNFKPQKAVPVWRNVLTNSGKTTIKKVIQEYTNTKQQQQWFDERGCIKRPPILGYRVCDKGHSSNLDFTRID